MIPIPGTWTAARALVVLVAALALLGFGSYLGWNASNDAWKGRWEKRENEWQGKVLEAVQKARAAETRAAEEVAKARDDYAARMDELRNSHAAALDQLRRDKARAALKPAAAAPAPCRDFAADGTQLSTPDAEFLIGEAARADTAVHRLATCQRFAGAILRALTGTDHDARPEPTPR